MHLMHRDSKRTTLTQQRDEQGQKNSRTKGLRTAGEKYRRKVTLSQGRRREKNFDEESIVECATMNARRSWEILDGHPPFIRNGKCPRTVGDLAPWVD